MLLLFLFYRKQNGSTYIVPEICATLQVSFRTRIQPKIAWFQCPFLNQYSIMPSHLSHVNPNNLKIKVRVLCFLSLDTFERYFQFFGLLTHWKSNSHRIPLTLSINRDYYKTEITYFIQQIFKEQSLPGTSMDIKYTIVKWKHWQRGNIRAEG